MTEPSSRSASRMLVMGIVNVTPDSFSDGGLYLSHDAAIGHARGLVASGAGVVDIGGESTRPGAMRIGTVDEQKRVIPVIRVLAADGIRVSVDTMNAETALAAVEAGAEIVNDVSGGLADPAMASAVAETGASFILSHWRGHSDTMDGQAEYGDVVADVVAEISARVDAVVAAGIAPERIVIDPGLGFAKRAEHNWEILRRIPELQAIGLPVLIGASRKRFIGDLLEPGVPMVERDLLTAVVSALLADAGLWGVRVHNVASTSVALDAAARLRR